MGSEAQKKELTELISSSHINPHHQYIDNIIPEEKLHQYDPKVVLEVAYQHGCVITRCSNSDIHTCYKANGVDVELDFFDPLAQKLGQDENIRERYCNYCAETEAIRAKALEKKLYLELVNSYQAVA